MTNDNNRLLRLVGAGGTKWRVERLMSLLIVKNEIKWKIFVHYIISRFLHFQQQNRYLLGVIVKPKLILKNNADKI